MPLRPFPPTITTGTDICHSARFMKYFPPITASSSSFSPFPSPTIPSLSTGSRRAEGEEKTYSIRNLYKLFDKVFTEREQEAFWRRFGTWRGVRGSTVRRERVVRWMGGRWAAKEAIIKAHSAAQLPTSLLSDSNDGKDLPRPRKVFMRDIEIHTDGKSKAPYGLILDPPSTNHQTRTAEEVFERCKRSVLSKWRSDIFIAEEKEEEGSLRSRQATKQILNQQTGQLDFGAVVEALGEENDELDDTVAPKSSPARANEEQGDDEGNGGAFDIGALHGQIVPISISHDGEYVVATALCSYEIIAREQIAAKQDSKNIGEGGNQEGEVGPEKRGSNRKERSARRPIGSTKPGST